MRRHALIFSLLVSCVLAFGACSSGKKEQDAVAMVNDAPITAEELKSEVARYARQNPSQAITRNTIDDRLKVMIEQKPLIQEAVKKRLHEDRKFTDRGVFAVRQSLVKAWPRSFAPAPCSGRTPGTGSGKDLQNGICRHLL